LSAPVATRRYVYVAMPAASALARIDGALEAAETVAAGAQPWVVAAIPGSDAAVALDRALPAATIVRPVGDTDQRVTLRTWPRLNVISVAPSGRFAVAWFDLALAIQQGTVTASSSLDGLALQAVTVLSLTAGAERALDVSVGFRPRAVGFDAAGTRAFVVTDDGISAIDLAAPAGVAAPLSVGDDASAPEVLVTSDGAYAISRLAGRAELRVLALAGGARAVVSLPAEATDVDLSPDGRHAYAVLRDTSQLAVVDVAAATVELVDLDGEQVGSATLDATGGRAVLYTNAAQVERVTVIDLGGAPWPRTTYTLRKGVRTAAFAPDGGTILVLHAPRADADPGSVDGVIDRGFGYSLIDLATGFIALTPTPVDPGPFAFTPDGRQAYVLLAGAARAQVVDLATFVVDDLALLSTPEAVGVLPDAGVAWISQHHPLGRVSFVDLQTRAVRTLTGFSLDAHVVE
jgi:DNA-binding beta-propeller fold protein YncE